MKILKKIIAIITFIIIVSMIGGYFYFDKKFTPKPNSLSVENSTTVNFIWTQSNFSPIASMLIPIKLKNYEKTFYMQFDTGSPYTIFYKKAFDSVPIPTSFLIENMKISSKNFKTINYGSPIDTNKKINIIGTIGTDLLEKRTICINYKKRKITFNTSKIIDGTKFTFKKRLILFPSEINKKKIDVIFDTGTSAFSFITQKEIFDTMITQNSSIKKVNGNSWGNSLSIFSGKTEAKIKLGNTILSMEDVTYIDGYSTFQYLMMKFSGMGGMLGNKLFLEKTLTIDCKNQQFKID